MKDISELPGWNQIKNSMEDMSDAGNTRELDVTPEMLEAQKKAMSLLQHMDRTEWELRDKLKQKGYSQEAIETAIDYVASFHYIDDLRYATQFVQYHYQQRSMMRLKQDLYKRHVPEEYIDIALESVEWDESYALQDAIRKLVKDQELSEYTYEEKQKLAGKLYRKGFKLQEIKKKLDM